MMLIIIAVGYGITKTDMFSKKARSDMTNVVIYIVLPCSIFGSFHKGISMETMLQCGVVLLVALGLQVFYVIIKGILFRRIVYDKRIVLQYATMFNNASFMGLPILGTVFGDKGLLFGSIVLIPLRIFMWTTGLSLFAGSGIEEGKGVSRQGQPSLTSKAQIGKIWKKTKPLLTHPCIWAVILGFVYIFSPISLSAFLSDAINSIGSCNTALSMMLVGSILSDVNAREVFDRDCFYYSLIRLILIPAFAFGVLTLMRIDALVIGVVVLSASMPAAMTTAMLADKYGCNAAFASKTILVSTAISLVTLPLISAFLTSRL